MEKKKGLTKDAGWQFGIRKSVPLNLNQVWEFLLSDNGIKIWIQSAEKEFSTYKELSHVRTKWKLKGWTNEASLQMRVLSNNGKTTIAFHIDHLTNESQREETKAYWTEILESITNQLKQKVSDQ